MGMNRLVACSLLVLATAAGAQSPAEPSVIPRPTSMTAGRGVFRLTARTVIVATRADSLAAKRLARDLAPATGFDLAVRYGFEGAATEIQDLYLSGGKGAAMARVPAELIDAVALVGPRERIRERLAVWRESPVTTLNLTVFDIETLRVMIELLSEIA